MSKLKYRTDALASLHKIAADLETVGVLTPDEMAQYNITCLTPMEPLTPRQIRDFRASLEMTRLCFGQIFGASEDKVYRWETGISKPSPPTLRLLSLARTHGLARIV